MVPVRTGVLIRFVCAAVFIALLTTGCGSSSGGSGGTSGTGNEAGPGETTRPVVPGDESGSDGDAGSGDNADGGSVGGPETSDEDAPADADDPPGQSDGTESVPGLLDREQAAAAVAELGGQLAIGNANTIAVARPDGTNVRPLDGGAQRIAAQPTWSPDGRKLVWSSVSALEQSARVQSFDEDGNPDGAPIDSAADGLPVFYYQWTADGETILYLRNSPAAGNIESGAFIPGKSIEPVDQGAPFFVSWSPTGDRVAANVGNRSVRVYDQYADAARAGATAGATPIYELVTDGTGFSAPAWIDETTVLIVIDGWLTALVLDDDGTEQERRRLVRVATPMRFVMSPDRRRIAYQALVAPGLQIDQAHLRVPAGPAERRAAGRRQPTGSEIRPVQRDDGPVLAVFDLETGSRTTVTDEAALAWEWSPDGEKLAWLGSEAGGLGVRGRWHFWSTTGRTPPGDATSPLVTLSSKETRNYLPFFAQYAQSVTRWSPDSSAFALAGTIRPDSGPAGEGIWIQLVDEPAQPVLVAEGDFVSWGPGPTPPAAGTSPA